MNSSDLIHENVYFKNKDFILKINQEKNISKVSWDTDYLDSSFFYNLIRDTDNLELVEYLIDNIENENFRELINLFKYIICNVYYLISIDENKLHNDLLNLAYKLNKDENFKINLYNPSILYHLSYFNFNKKEININYNKLIKKSFPSINHSNNYVKVKKQKIKIGFICFYIIQRGICSVFRDRSQVFMKLDSNKFEKYLIYGDMSEQINSKDKEFITSSIYLNQFINSMDYKIKIDFCLKNYDNYVKQLLNLKLDVIVYDSIGMEPRGMIFSNYRLAPVQINTWGHSITSGASEIDYFFSSKYYELEDLDKAQEFYSEKLVALDSLCTCYPEMKSTLDMSREQLKLPNDKNILFCLVYYKKINLEFIDVLNEILSNLEDTIVIMLNFGVTIEKQNFIKNKLNDKILFIDKCDYKTFNNYIYHSTLVIDTYPFGGCNTSLDTFLRGRIVITRPSEFLPGRFTYGFYKRMGITEPICNSYKEYIEKVIFYVNNKKERELIENKIMENRHLLFNDIESINEWQEKIIELSEPYVELIDINFTFDYLKPTPLCLLMSKYNSYKGNKNIENSWHNYTTLYYEMFKEIKDKKLRIFELGIGTNNLNIPFNSGTFYKPGASLLAWRDFFVNSDIFGADIDGDVLFNIDRIKTFYCDQKNEYVIDYMWKEKELLEPFDIIIDDGYKDIKYNYLFLEKSIYKLNENGYYIIEGIPVHQVDLWKEKILSLKLKYDNLLFKLIPIPSLVNQYDNNILVINKYKN